MTVIIDPSSVKIERSHKGVRPNVHVGTQAAFAHLTQNAMKSVADTLGKLYHLPPPIVYKGFCTAQADPTEIYNWDFKFLQVAECIVSEQIWAGKTPDEGSMKFNEKLVWTKNPVIDKTEQDDAMSTVIKPKPHKPGVFDISIEFKDAPGQLSLLKEQNRASGAINYLYSLRRDDGYTTVFVADSPHGVRSYLGYFTWHLIWHAEFQWRNENQGPLPIMKNSLFDLSEISYKTPPQNIIDILNDNNHVPANKQSELADAVGFEQRRNPPLSQERTFFSEIPANWFNSE